MKQLFFSIVILLTSIFSFSQSTINLDLKKELEEILKSDQFLREYSDRNTSSVRKSEIELFMNLTKEELNKNLWTIINKQDSLNLIKIEKIISKYGYPGRTLVGEKTNEAAWYVIQHSEEIPKYFEIIKKAGKKKEIPLRLVAMMEDRKLMYEEKEQIYGSQGAGRFIINDKGEKIFFNFIWPIKNQKKVNRLRKKIGFSNSIEEYAKILGIEYKIYTMSDYYNFKIVN